jgi:Flp pilus assembly protein TadG
MKAGNMKPIKNRRELSRGQALIEFALVLPLLFLLIVNVINFAGFFFAWISVSNAARAGAQYMIMGGATVRAPKAPTATQVTTIVQQDIHALPNSSSVVVTLCTNNNGTMTPSGCSAPGDPEPGGYVLAAVDVTYTYQPFIPLWDFPKLGIHATLPATTIHRKSVMRVLQ